MESKSIRDTRLDLAKAIAISLVLIWHLQPIQLNLASNSHFILKLIKFGIDQVYYQVTLLAVPLFFLVSSYLFFVRMGDQPVEYSKKRFSRILLLYVVWTAIQFVVFYIFRLSTYISTGKAEFRLPMNIAELIMQGGPGLPYVGGSIYYFLFVLLAVIILSTVFGLIKDKKITSVFAWLIILVSLIHFEIGGNIPYWRVDNFLVYVPIAFLLWKDKTNKKAISVPILFIGYALFSLHDLYLRQAGYHFEGYSRISVVLGAAALLSAILQISNLEENKTVSFLSRYSLGIFATHKFWQLLVILVMLELFPSLSDTAALQPLDLSRIIISIIVIPLTFLFIYLTRNSRLKRFIS